MIKVQDRFVTFIPLKDAKYLMGDFTDWDEKPLAISEPITLEFPRGAYIEYAFLDAHQRPLADLANPERPKNPWYDYHRAIILPHNRFQMPPRPKTFRGSVSKYAVTSRLFNEQRTYYVYEPAIFPLTTIYVQDGEAFYQKLQFQQVAEALIEQEAIKPVRLVFMEPNHRESEYWFNERYEAFLLEEMLPDVDRRYGKTKESGLWGASLGGLVSVWLAWRNPQIFSKVGSQSGCFTAHPEGNDEYHDPEWLTERLATSDQRPLRFYVQTGQIEWLLAPNRRFAAMLADKAYPHCYQEQPSGHNWATWEQGLAPGLMYLFDRAEENISLMQP
jgi:enterochelin esterase-like enzyme